MSWFILLLVWVSWLGVYLLNSVAIVRFFTVGVDICLVGCVVVCCLGYCLFVWFCGFSCFIMFGGAFSFVCLARLRFVAGGCVLRFGLVWFVVVWFLVRCVSVGLDMGFWVIVGGLL